MFEAGDSLKLSEKWLKANYGPSPTGKEKFRSLRWVVLRIQKNGLLVLGRTDIPYKPRGSGPRQGQTWSPSFFEKAEEKPSV